MLARPTRRAWGYCDSSAERGTQLSAWERTQPLRREQHAHRWPSMVRGAMLARPTRRAWGCCDSSGERGTQLSAWERTQPLRRERHAHRWPSMVRGAMLATTWNLSSPSVATILAGEHSRQGLREMLLKTPERGAVPELVYRYPQIAMHLPQKAVSPVQNYILKRPAGPGIAVLGTCWPRRLHRDLRLGHTIQGSHPSLDLVSTSEVITALSRKKQVNTKTDRFPRNTAKNGYTILFFFFFFSRFPPNPGQVE